MKSVVVNPSPPAIQLRGNSKFVYQTIFSRYCGRLGSALAARDWVEVNFGLLFGPHGATVSGSDGPISGRLVSLHRRPDRSREYFRGFGFPVGDFGQDFGAIPGICGAIGRGTIMTSREFC